MLAFPVQAIEHSNQLITESALGSIRVANNDYFHAHLGSMSGCVLKDIVVIGPCPEIDIDFFCSSIDHGIDNDIMLLQGGGLTWPNISFGRDIYSAWDVVEKRKITDLSYDQTTVVNKISSRGFADISPNNAKLPAYNSFFVITSDRISDEWIGYDECPLRGRERNATQRDLVTSSFRGGIGGGYGGFHVHPLGLGGIPKPGSGRVQFVSERYQEAVEENQQPVRYVVKNEAVVPGLLFASGLGFVGIPIFGFRLRRIGYRLKLSPGREKAGQWCDRLSNWLVMAPIVGIPLGWVLAVLLSMYADGRL